MRKQQYYLLLLVILPSVLAAQSPSTKGTDFWLGFMYNYETAATKEKTLTLFISADEGTNGKVEIPGINWDTTFTVATNSTTEIVIPRNAESPFEEGKAKSGIHITSELAVSVYALSYLSATSDAAIVYPTNTLGKVYLGMDYASRSPRGNLFPSELLILAVENDTEIEIIPTNNTGGGIAVGSSFIITLQQGETYQLLGSRANESLTGTLIRSVPNSEGECKDFAVFGGHACAEVPIGVRFCDHLFEQIPPVSRWGSSFVVVPFETRETDIIRILAADDNTTLTYGINTYQLNSGEFLELELDQTTWIASDRPLLVAQFSTGGDFDQNPNADPFMIVVSPIEQTIPVISFNAFDSPIIERYFVNLVCPTDRINETTFDGMNLGRFFNILNDAPEFAYAQVEISKGNHTIENPGGLIAYVYGYGAAESYGYVAGANLKNLALNFNIIIDGDTIPYSEFNGSLNPRQMISFEAMSRRDDLNLMWDFGDGNIAEGRNVSFSFPSCGTIDLSLSVNSRDLCPETISVPVQIDGSVETQISETICMGESLEGYTIAGTYIDTFLSTSNCDSIRTLELTISSPEFLGVDIQNTTCGENNGQLFIQARDPFSNLQYSINQIDYQDQPVFGNLEPGTYNIFIQNESGCTVGSQTSIATSQPISLSIDSIQDVSCDNANGVIQVQGALGIRPLEFRINEGNYQLDSTFSELVPGTYKLEVRDVQGCTDSLLIDINAEPTPQITADFVEAASCGLDNGMVEVTTSGGVGTLSIELNNTGLQTSNQFSGLAAGTYTIYVTDDNLCMDSLDITIGESELPKIEVVNAIPTSCGLENGQLIVVGSGGEGNLRFSIDGTNFSEFSNFENLSAGKYPLFVKDQEECLVQDSFEIAPSNPLQILNIFTEPAPCGRDEGVFALELNDKTGPIQLILNRESNFSGRTVENLEEGTYEVQVFDQNGCVVDTFLNISSTDCPFYVPNAFSPNGDGINDFFELGVPANKQDAMVKLFMVYDRWGNKVYELRNFPISSGFSWNGRMNGEPLMQGVYIYYFDIDLRNNESYLLQGEVTLIR
ncbi:MAG: gliding motility-associated C-terminal domain-containing protein [Bacteroidota bacterium]